MSDQISLPVRRLLEMFYAHPISAVVDWDVPDDLRDALHVAVYRGLVRKLPGAHRLSPIYWGLTVEGLGALKDVPSKVGAKDAKEPKLDARALALFIENPTMTKTEIAKKLELKNVRSLSRARCPQLNSAIAAHKAAIDPGSTVRGSKDADGNLDAWIDGPDHDRDSE